MIVLYHKNKKISKVILEDKSELSFAKQTSIAFGLMQMAERYPKSKLIWCQEELQDVLNLSQIDELMHHDRIMLSFNPSTNNYLGNRVGYVEDSPFIKINKEVSYPTWQMSSVVGVIHASVLIVFKDKIKLDSGFDFYLNSIAKVGMPLGLFCYSEPKLLNQALNKVTSKTSVFTLFRFVKQHYKTRWIFLLLLNLLVYELRFPLLAVLYALFFKNRTKLLPSLSSIAIQSNKVVVQSGTIDVIIPTIGRKKYLYDVLQDLAQQTYLPKNVIIVEQNSEENSVSELDYLENKNWPFVIKHTFTNQAGACNARNLALSLVESEWVFLNDDDNRFGEDLLKKMIDGMSVYGLNCIITSYLQQNEIKKYIIPQQTVIFGSGNSIVKSSLLHSINFNLGYEFGYGEDSDFGMQLRNHGTDIIYLPNIEILHLKAPIGGFRIKPTFAWDEESIQPKPSPTIMLYKLLHLTQEQLLGYKTVLFIRTFQVKQILNFRSQTLIFQKKWDRSLYWAKKLNVEEK